jgi:formylglycine-generating enzyme required for sulfatase activity
MFFSSPGFYVLSGNVAEWMLDWFDRKDPEARRVLRGSDWYSVAKEARSAIRIGNTPTHANFSNGFRLARGRLQSGEAGSR